MGINKRLGKSVDQLLDEQGIFVRCPINLLREERQTIKEVFEKYRTHNFDENTTKSDYKIYIAYMALISCIEEKMSELEVLESQLYANDPIDEIKQMINDVATKMQEEYVAYDH